MKTIFKAELARELGGGLLSQRSGGRGGVFSRGGFLTGCGGVFSEGPSGAGPLENGWRGGTGRGTWAGDGGAGTVGRRGRGREGTGVQAVTPRPWAPAAVGGEGTQEGNFSCWTGIPRARQERQGPGPNSEVTYEHGFEDRVEMCEVLLRRCAWISGKGPRNCSVLL